MVDDPGFGPILHPLAPAWFNQLIDNLQIRALRRALTLAEVPPGARFLDVGCGTGRWVRRYGELGAWVWMRRSACFEWHAPMTPRLPW
jgi:SAM-dependent methyltransferase